MTEAARRGGNAAAGPVHGSCRQRWPCPPLAQVVFQMRELLSVKPYGVAAAIGPVDIQITGFDMSESDPLLGAATLRGACPSTPIGSTWPRPAS